MSVQTLIGHWAQVVMPRTGLQDQGWSASNPVLVLSVIKKHAMDCLMQLKASISITL